MDSTDDQISPNNQLPPAPPISEIPEEQVVEQPLEPTSPPPLPKKGLSRSQKISVIALMLPLLALPVAIMLALSPVQLFKHAAETVATPPAPTDLPPPPPDNPTSTPIPVSLLVITTPKDLPSGKVGRKYSTIIRGYTTNPYTSLSMTANNLPPGLSKGSCTSEVIKERKYLNCSIVGTPKTAGKYTPMITLKTSSGEKTSKLFLITISP